MDEFNEGLARNINKLTTGFGGLSCELYRGLDKTIDRLDVSADKQEFTFHFEDGTKATFGVEGDCCSRSWIEHITVPADLKGQVLVGVSDERVSQERYGEYDELLQVYSTRFRTAKGDLIVLEYRNESNGYYGGYLIRKDEEVQ